MTSKAGFKKMLSNNGIEISSSVTNKNSDIKVTDKTISEHLSDNLYKFEYKYGTIFQVLPLNDIIKVSIKKYNEYDDEGHELNNAFYNDFKLEKETALFDIMIPLVNFNEALFQVDLNFLIGKYVKVKVLDEIFAVEAELIAQTEFEITHAAQPTLKDMKRRVDNEISFIRYYASLGYDVDVLEDFMSLKVKDYEVRGVFRFENEAYWDKDVAGMDELDILIEDKDSPLYLLGRNYLTMKNKLCHMPTIMFTGR